MVKRALVTGSAGFVGRHMVDELIRRDWTVHNADVARGRDALHLFRHAETPRYDLVVHCAFHVGGRAQIEGNSRLLAKNLELDACLFDWAVRTRQRRVLYFSSSAAYPIELQIYGQTRRLAEPDIDLADIRQPDADYGFAKLAGERLAESARKSGLQVSVVRPFSGYGEDQAEGYPFRALVERAKRHENPYVIWGPGTQVRDWIHINDVVNGALSIVEAGCTDPINLCAGLGTSMLELAQMCCEATGYVPEFAPNPNAPTGVAHRVGDPTRFFDIYRPRIELAEGVKRGIAHDGLLHPV